MKRVRQNPYIERGWIRFVGTHGFIYCFAVVTVAAIVAGVVRRGPAILAFPMLAWSPFFLLIGLHAASRAINEFRDGGAPTFPEETRAQRALSVVIDLAIIAVLIIPMLYRFGNANRALNTIWYLPFLMFVILDLASHVFGFVRNPWRSILRRAIPPASWFFMTIYLVVGAFWMLFIGKALHP